MDRKLLGVERSRVTRFVCMWEFFLIHSSKLWIKERERTEKESKWEKKRSRELKRYKGVRCGEQKKKMENNRKNREDKGWGQGERKKRGSQTEGGGGRVLCIVWNLIMSWSLYRQLGSPPSFCFPAGDLLRGSLQHQTGSKVNCSFTYSGRVWDENTHRTLCLFSHIYWF